MSIKWRTEPKRIREKKMADDSEPEPLMPEKDLDNLLEQLGRVLGDKDRVRLVNAAADGWTFTCEQVGRLLRKAQYGDAQRNIAINLYARVSDPDNFEAIVLQQSLDFEEDRVEVRNAIGL